MAAEPSLAIYLAGTPLFLDPVAPHFATGMTQIGVETSAELRRVDYGSSSGKEETPPNVRFSKVYSMYALPPKADKAERDPCPLCGGLMRCNKLSLITYFLAQRGSAP